MDEYLLQHEKLINEAYEEHYNDMEVKTLIAEVTRNIINMVPLDKSDDVCLLAQQLERLSFRRGFDNAKNRYAHETN